jgi:hypothetical protein
MLILKKKGFLEVCLMKHLEFLLKSSFLVFAVHTSNGQNLYELKLKPMWQELNCNQKNQFENKWIFAGTIDLKKRSAQDVNLEQLVLHWHGKNLDNLLGSLYKKELDRPLLPLQEHLICDSYWDGSNQKLILKFDHPLPLTAHTSLCLVLTIPPTLEPTIKDGRFVLENNSLPYPLRKSFAKQPFTLAFN